MAQLRRRKRNRTAALPWCSIWAVSRAHRRCGRCAGHQPAGTAVAVCYGHPGRSRVTAGRRAGCTASLPSAAGTPCSSAKQDPSTRTPMGWPSLLAIKLPARLVRVLKSCFYEGTGCRLLTARCEYNFRPPPMLISAGISSNCHGLFCCRHRRHIGGAETLPDLRQAGCACCRSCVLPPAGVSGQTPEADGRRHQSAARKLRGGHAFILRRESASRMPSKSILFHETTAVPLRRS